MLHPELLEQLEIIVVNDGSGDDTAAVAEEFVKQYPQTVRLINQDNKGHGGALNTGCAAARGKYLKVVDADDWVETDNLPALLSFLSSCKSDVVLTHHDTQDISTGEVRNWKSYPKTFGKAYTLEHIMLQPYNFDRSLTFHGITYRTKFYQSQHIPLSEKVFYEDHEYATFACCKADTITALDLLIYHYRIGDVQQSVSDANQLKRLSHMETVLNRFLTEYKNLPTTDGGRSYFEMKAQGVLLAYITTVMLVEPNRKKGRQLGKSMMSRFRDRLPGAYERSVMQYRIFRIMNCLHLKKATWERILHSKLYRKLRHSHDFN
jgi:hypothetical protein